MLNLELSKKNLALLQSQQNAVQRKADIGMATQMDVLNAKSAVENMEVTYFKHRKADPDHKAKYVSGHRMGLQCQSGKSGNLPSVSKDEILAINLDADKEEAVKNNYTCRQTATVTAIPELQKPRKPWKRL